MSASLSFKSKWFLPPDLSCSLIDITQAHIYTEYSAWHILGIWYRRVVVVVCCCCFYHHYYYSLLLFFQDGKILIIVRLGQWFSNLSLHQNYLEAMLKHNLLGHICIVSGSASLWMGLEDFHWLATSQVMPVIDLFEFNLLGCTVVLVYDSWIKYVLFKNHI